jgi:hypothetical protein
MLTRDEAISYIEKNWPPENYVGLREALTMAIAALKPPSVAIPSECCVCPIIVVCEQAKWFPDPQKCKARGSIPCVDVWKRNNAHFGRTES